MDPKDFYHIYRNGNKFVGIPHPTSSNPSTPVEDAKVLGWNPKDPPTVGTKGLMDIGNDQVCSCEYQGEKVE